MRKFMLGAGAIALLAGCGSGGGAGNVTPSNALNGNLNPQTLTQSTSQIPLSFVINRTPSGSAAGQIYDFPSRANSVEVDIYQGPWPSPPPGSSFAPPLGVTPLTTCVNIPGHQAATSINANVPSGPSTVVITSFTGACLAGTGSGSPVTQTSGSATASTGNTNLLSTFLGAGSGGTYKLAPIVVSPSVSPTIAPSALPSPTASPTTTPNPIFSGATWGVGWQDFVTITASPSDPSYVTPATYFNSSCAPSPACLPGETISQGTASLSDTRGYNTPFTGNLSGRIVQVPASWQRTITSSLGGGSFSDVEHTGAIFNAGNPIFSSFIQDLPATLWEDALFFSGSALNVGSPVKFRATMSISLPSFQCDNVSTPPNGNIDVRLYLNDNMGNSVTLECDHGHPFYSRQNGIFVPLASNQIVISTDMTTSTGYIYPLVGSLSGEQDDAGIFWYLSPATSSINLNFSWKENILPLTRGISVQSASGHAY